MSIDEWTQLQKDHLAGFDPWADPGESEFDVDAANEVLTFFQGLLQFIEGAKPGSPFVLQPWQQAFLGCLFGWKRPDGTRRFRETLLYVARKNGKTPVVAGIALYIMFCDNEPGAQIYSAAADREQASLIYRWASNMIAKEPVLSRKVKVYKSFKSIEYPKDGTFFKALSRESNTKHGLNAHCILVDELHAMQSGELVNTLRTSTASRTQPLVVHITTADYDRESICNEIHSYGSRVRDGHIHDQSFLPVIYEASSDDDWTDPDVWAKANPNLGVSVSQDYLERECQRAKDEPTYENTFKRLHLNIKTEQAERVMPMDAWDDSFTDQEGLELEVRPCWGGLDLAQRNDIASFSLCWPPEDEEGEWVYRWWYWVPEDVVELRARQHGQPYDVWVRDGIVTATEGNDIDYGRIRRDIVEICGRHNVVDVGYDPYNATHMQQMLREQDGIQMFPVRQGMLSMSEPTKHLLGRVAAGKINHGGCPVARWMAGNLAVKRDQADNIVPVKNKSTGKIDGIVASVIATSRALFAEDEQFDEPGMAIIA